MKKYILTTAMIAISYLGFAQLSQAGLFRVADRTAATIGSNLPVGTQVFAIADSSLWAVTIAIDGATTPVTVNAAYAAGKLTRINKGGTFIVQQFDAVADVALPTYTLTNTPFGGLSGVSVSLNGAVLKATKDYTYAASVITFTIPVYTYDRISVAYTYQRYIS